VGISGKEEVTLDLYKNYRLWGSAHFRSGPGTKRIEVGTFDWADRPKARITAYQEAIPETGEREHVIGFVVFPLEILAEVRAAIQKAEAAALDEQPTASSDSRGA
jgi:hypothetical protein